MQHTDDPFAATFIWCASERGPALPWPGLPPATAEDDERYAVGELLGQGGMALVFAATDRATGQEVAIKVARRDLPARCDRFLLNELAVLGQLRAPGTLRVLDSGTTAGGRPFFTMRRVGGGTLAELIDLTLPAHPTLRQALIRRRLLSSFDRVCKTITEAHAQGLVHRDLKPTNVLVSGYDDAVVIDWGLSGPIGAGLCIAAEEPGADSAGGTPGYIAPEALRRGLSQSDHRADVWSLGAVLYELLTLQRAIPRSSLHGMVAASLLSRPAPPIELVPDLVGGRSMSQVVLKAMAQAPEDRYASVEQLRAAVREAVLAQARRPDLLASAQ